MADNNMDDDRYNCCCGHIKTCAKIVAGIGIFCSVVSLISAIFYWYYLPMSIAYLTIYCLVFVGINKLRPSYLLPAKIILAISIILNIILVIALFVLGFILPSTLFAEYNKQKYNKLVAEAKQTIQTTLFTTAAILLLSSCYTIFSFVVIHKARKYLLENSASKTIRVSAPASSMYPNGSSNQ